MTEQERERYQRNLLVEGFSPIQQQQLSEACVSVVGAGGLGSAALSYLVAVGIGHIRIIENDVVSRSNLQRQILYTTSDLGTPKAEAAAARLSRLNPGCEIEIRTDRLTAPLAESLLAGSDVVIDCTDNYQTRYIIDDYCEKHHTPMVYGTAEQIGGQVSIFHTTGAGSYRSLYPEEADQRAVVGVLSPIVGVIGSLQALETVKLITGIGNGLIGRLLLIDGRTLQITTFEIETQDDI